MRRVLALVILLATLVGAILLARRDEPAARVATAPPTRAATTSAPAPSSAPSPATTLTSPAATATSPLRSYSEWVQRQPEFASAQREKRLLPLFDAAHLQAPGGAVIDSDRGLWVIDQNALPFATAAQKSDSAERTTCDRVLAVFWSHAGRAPRAVAVVQKDGAFLLLGADGSSRRLSRTDYDWSRSRYLFNDNVVVPGARSVAMINIGDEAREVEYEFSEAGDEPVQLVEMASEVIAYLPQHTARVAGAPVVFYDFDAAAWKTAGHDGRLKGPVLYVHAPGTQTLQLIRPGEKPDRVSMQVVPRQRIHFNRGAVEKLVQQLSADQAHLRDEAERDLDRPFYHDVLRELAPNQPPEARLRLTEILAKGERPVIGSWQIRNSRLQLTRRLHGGGAVFHVPEGLVAAQGGGEPAEAMSYLAVGGEHTGPLPALASASVEQGVWLLPGDWDWIVWHEGGYIIAGTQHRLTRKDESRFRQFVGAWDSGYVFRDPQTGACLLIDRRTADPAPRLPGWEITVDGETGWDSANWPAMRKGGAWSLREKGWRPLKPNDEKFLATGAATQPGEAMPVSPLVTVKGGNDQFTITTEGQPAETVSLPAEARGTLALPLFVLTPGDNLYLYNEPGRIVQLHREGGRWAVKIIHNRNLPQSAAPSRFWMDPAGRLCLAWDSRLAILFPQGRIPPEILDLMPREQLLRLNRE